jgi:hypothetical protein
MVRAWALARTSTRWACTSKASTIWTASTSSRRCARITEAGEDGCLLQGRAHRPGSRRGRGTHRFGRGRLRHLRGRRDQRGRARRRDVRRVRATDGIERRRCTTGRAAARGWGRSRTRAARPSAWPIACAGPKYDVQLPALDDASRGARRRAGEAPARTGQRRRTRSISRPMAGEAAYEAAARVMLACDEIDAIMVSRRAADPDALGDPRRSRARVARRGARTPPAESATSRSPRCIDSGAMYEPLVRKMREVASPSSAPPTRRCDRLAVTLAHHARPDRPTIDTKVRAVAAVETH